jgi:purine-nucleoside phosphorylase
MNAIGETFVEGDQFVEEGVALIRERTQVRPRVAVVLGSGLGDAVSADVRPDAEFSFGTLPGFPRGTVPGHAGRLLLGELYGVPSAVFLGRVHLYEGHGIGATTLIPRLVAQLGARVIVLTNASGGLDPSMSPGQLMLIHDHINLMGVNPLSGWRIRSGSPAFVDLSGVYDTDLLELARRAAGEGGLEVRAGVYVALSGPSYETPAESKFLRLAGADAVGMSTVPEAVAAVALGLRVLGISCISNLAGRPAGHEDVLASAKRASEDLRSILGRVIPALPTSP